MSCGGGVPPGLPLGPPSLVRADVHDQFFGDRTEQLVPDNLAKAPHSLKTTDEDFKNVLNAILVHVCESNRRLIKGYGPFFLGDTRM